MTLDHTPLLEATIGQKAHKNSTIVEFLCAFRYIQHRFMENKIQYESQSEKWWSKVTKGLSKK